MIKLFHNRRSVPYTSYGSATGCNHPWAYCIQQYHFTNHSCCVILPPGGYLYDYKWTWWEVCRILYYLFYIENQVNNYHCFTESAVENGGRLDLIASGTKQFIQSPSYPNMVLPGLREVWVIKAEGLRKVITVQVRSFFKGVKVMLTTLCVEICLEKPLCHCMQPIISKSIDQ